MNELTVLGEVVRLTSILPITKPERAPVAAKDEQQIAAAEEGNGVPAADVTSPAQAATAAPGAGMSLPLCMQDGMQYLRFLQDSIY